MVRTRLTALVLILLFGSLSANDDEKLTLKDIFDSDKFHGRTISSIEWQPDSKAFTFTRKNRETGQLDIYRHEVKTGDETLLVAGADLMLDSKPINMNSYSWTDDGKYLLLEGEVKQIWRHSTQAPYYLFEVGEKKLIPLANNAENLRNVKLSPDGKRVGYVQNHNIFTFDLDSKKVKQVTKHGTKNILNGEFDWVYEEEFGLADAWRWSPDGSKIAFWQIDQMHIREFYLVDQMTVYNTITGLKYPKAGVKNPTVKIGVADLRTGEMTWMSLGDEPDIYVPRIFWTNSSKKLAIFRLNRLQNHLEILMADTETGETRTVIEDNDEKWVDVRQDIFFLKTKDQIIFPSEKSGFKHAYLYDYDGNLVNQITTGDWEITKIEGVDEEQSLLYVSGKKDSPIEQHVYRVKLDGSKFEQISQRPGWHSGTFSPDFKHVVGFYSDIKTPTQIMLRKTDGSLVRYLEKNEMSVMKEIRPVYPEFLTFETTDGTLLNAYMMKPHDFNPEKKYPVIVYGYGGPGSQMVVNRWGTGSRSYHYSQRVLWHQYMTEQGYLVFCVDNRGTGGRGKAFKNLAYGDLSKWSVHDQVEGAKYLRSLEYVDDSRIGFWGWSGGGYLALMLMTRAGDYFKTGVSVAPVSDFHLYDTIWTERYMGLPHENVEGYKAANVLNYVDGLKGNLLIIHGTGDDNVHVQNTMQVVNELQKRGIQFDMMLYPNKNHRISGGKTQLHLFTFITNYFLRNL